MARRPAPSRYLAKPSGVRKWQRRPTRLEYFGGVSCLRNWHRKTTRPLSKALVVEGCPRNWHRGKLSDVRPGTTRLRNVASQDDPPRPGTWSSQAAYGIGIVGPLDSDRVLWRSKLLTELALLDNLPSPKGTSS